VTENPLDGTTHPAGPTGHLRVRLGGQDTHYRDYLIPAASMLRIVADVATEIDVRDSGRPGLLARYESAEFLHPLKVGDYVDFYARQVRKGSRSRTVEVEVYRDIESPNIDEDFSAWRMHDPPQLVGSAVLVLVQPRKASA
jgi:acyl-CoA hydrolase